MIDFIDKTVVSHQRVIKKEDNKISVEVHVKMESEFIDENTINRATKVEVELTTNDKRIEFNTNSKFAKSG